jgi:hypothetical protein
MTKSTGVSNACRENARIVLPGMLDIGLLLGAGSSEEMGDFGYVSIFGVAALLPIRSPQPDTGHAEDDAPENDQ